MMCLRVMSSARKSRQRFQSWRIVRISRIVRTPKIARKSDLIVSVRDFQLEATAKPMANQLMISMWVAAIFLMPEMPPTGCCFASRPCHRSLLSEVTSVTTQSTASPSCAPSTIELHPVNESFTNTSLSDRTFRATAPPASQPHNPYSPTLEDVWAGRPASHLDGPSSALTRGARARGVPAPSRLRAAVCSAAVRAPSQRPRLRPR